MLGALFMWKVYILKSMEKLIYAGMTQNIVKRIEEHNSAKSYYTKRGTNWKMIYSETFNSSGEARKREKYFKILPGVVEKERNFLARFENPFFKTQCAIVPFIHCNEMQMDPLRTYTIGNQVKYYYFQIIVKMIQI